MKYSIAIDGPAGAGKSTIAKEIAKELSFIYIDTGAMYRAMALYFLNLNIDLNDQLRVEKECSGVNIEIEYSNGEQQVLLNEENVTTAIRNEQVGNGASIVAKYMPVREKLVELQRLLASKADVVMDGRDIGTYVLVDANLKVYLTASSRTRAERRWKELTDKNIQCNLDEIEADIIKRDEQDMNREISPLKQASDAVLVDSSYMNIEEVVKTIIDLYKKIL